MPIFQIVILAIIQGLAELLPVSSSAHVIVAEKLMGIDPSAPEMTFLLVMLHTGTMGAVLFYFWKRWKVLFTQKGTASKDWIKFLFITTAVTGVVGLTVKALIEKFVLGGGSKAEIEHLFSNLPLIACSLLAVGILILIAGLKKESNEPLTPCKSVIIGIVQGLCLPFRGFSRSGSTISTGLLLGVSRPLSEEFSFALAVILTPPVVLRELMRLLKNHELSSETLPGLLFPGFLGMCFSFAAGLIALKWVSAWIEKGRWSWFAYYCFIASGVVFWVNHSLGS